MDKKQAKYPFSQRGIHNSLGTSFASSIRSEKGRKIYGQHSGPEILRKIGTGREPDYFRIVDRKSPAVSQAQLGFRDELDHFFLSDIETFKQKDRNRKFIRTLLRITEQEALSKNKKKLVLEVKNEEAYKYRDEEELKRQKTAERLYESEGFRHVGYDKGNTVKIYEKEVSENGPMLPAVLTRAEAAKKRNLKQQKEP